MEDLDYKDLFRDAIHTIAYIARAAGFDPNDPTVEPPAIIARVESQRAALERLTAERAALLAPVEGVDVGAMLSDPDRSWLFAPWVDVQARLDVVPILAREVARLRAHLNTARRLLPPRYVASDGSILDPQRCTPHARDCAECGRGRAHDEECLGVLETPAEEVARLRALVDCERAEREEAERLHAVDEGTLQQIHDMLAPLFPAPADRQPRPNTADLAVLAMERLEEARLTLAAEQGRAEGAPFPSSPRLRAAVNAERIRQGLSWRELAAQINMSPSGFTRWNAGHELSVPAYLKVCDWLHSTILAADAATEAR